ncbi:hypothetical protein B0H11DRAFT_2238816 [Mycena galericulata]|nr:hypothetical protein B0H11DRAFT_2238816 [Mycena galericulata]
MQVTVNDKKGLFLLELARTIRRALDVRPRHDLLPARGGPAHAQEDPIHGLQRYIEERGLASEQVLKQLDKAELYPPRSPLTPHPRCTHDAPRPTGASPPTYVFTKTVHATHTLDTHRPLSRVPQRRTARRRSAHSTHARAAAADPAMLSVRMICRS